jgi:hypothetical protein
LKKDGIRLSFARVKDPVREMMHVDGAEEIIGMDNYYQSVSDGVRAFLQRKKENFRK